MSKLSTSVVTLFGLVALPASAAVTIFAEYHLGEAGSLGANNLPRDSSGNNRNAGNEINGANATVGSASFHPNAVGSTAYLDTSGAGNEGWYSSGLFNSLQTDNFALGVFARSASGSAANQGDIFTVGGGANALKISLAVNGWASSANGISWIGGNDGVVGSFSANTWVHLALVRSGGITTFYIDGSPQGPTWAGTPANDTPHFSVNPGGGAFFDGQLDEARVVTFTPGEPTANIITALQGVPEPTSAMFYITGLMMAMKRRRS